MAAGNWIMYDTAKLYIGDGTFDLNSNTFNIALMKSTYTPNRSTQSIWGGTGVSSEEIANGFGYTTGGAALGSVTFTETGGVATFDAADATWTASGGSIGPFQYAVIYAPSTLNTIVKPLLCYCQLDASPLTATDTQVITIQFNASGILTLSGATS